ncbi:hypothetical protein CPC16_012062 [Podila verticillata]|nr:hypothetical protein CPC16_012062 [Podila verticillata]
MSSHQGQSQGQGQGQGGQGQATTTTATRHLRIATPYSRRLRHQFLATLEALDSSDADASSDLSLSEVDQLPESESGFSEFETPLGGRWDMAAHWGDYSEGVEGDDDDDDDNDNDNDNDRDDEERDIDNLSEGLSNNRSIHLDLGRIQEILSSSPGSTPIVTTTTTTTSTSSAARGSHGSLLGPLLASATTITNSSVRGPGVSSSSGSSSQIEEPHNRHFRASFVSTPIVSPEPFLISRDEVHTDSYHGDMEDSQGESHQETNRGDTTTMFLQQDTEADLTSSTTGSYDRSDSARARALLRPSPPLLSREERRHIISAAGGILGGGPGSGGLGGSGELRTHSLLSRERERRLISRPGFWTSPRTHQLSPYWTALARQFPRVISSMSSVSSSPVSSASSSRTASPVIDNRLSSFSFKPPEDESSHSDPPGEGDATSTDVSQQQHHRRVVSTSIASLPLFVSSAFSPSPSLGVHGVGALDGVAHRPMKRIHRRPCCFLQPGQKFHGTQNLKTQTSNLAGRTGMEEWDVKVTISAVDYDAATVFGLMEAMDVPMSESNVVTFWEGEIIDFENHNFWTKKWAAKPKTDLDHWKRLEAFQGVEEKFIIRGAKNGKFGVGGGNISHKYIFMRWKEKHFVNSSEHTSGLTIAGFYYIAMRRADGAIEGYYHDQQSTPFQHLCLQPTFESRGFSSAIFELA